jgi:hypothetical protein
MYAEFNVTTMSLIFWPIAGLFDINSTGTNGTFLGDPNGDTIVSAANLYDATFTLSHAGPPTISSISLVPATPYPSEDEPVTVSANVTDNSGAGIANVTIVYSNDSWLMNSTAPMMLNTTTGLYVGFIPADACNTTLCYVVQAHDNNGGFAESGGGAYETVPEYEALSFLLIMITTSAVAIVIIRKRALAEGFRHCGLRIRSEAEQGRPCGHAKGQRN